jgi:tetratricopeptide (TPR) repeat protein
MAPGRMLWIGVTCVGLVVSAGTPRAQPQGLSRLIDLYQSGEFGAALHAAADDVQDLRQILQQLNMAVPLLSRAHLPDTAEDKQRRLAIATFALEVVMARRSSTFQDSGRLLLEWACALLRRDSTPMPAERLWHLAAIGVIEGAPDYTTLETHLAHAEKRFPKEPRFVLARAVQAEMQTWYGRVADSNDQLVSRMRIASLTPEVRDEALLRWGFFDLRRGSSRTALDHLNDIGPMSDGYLDYLRHLFLGRALDKSKKPSEAIEAYRRAIIVEPRAQTAQLALASALAAGNSRQEAFDVLNHALSGPRDVLADPWFTYGAGDQRFWPALVTQLRQAVRR